MLLNKRNFYKENKGFTLVEMVISVAFLAVISIFLLQLFIAANNLSIKAHDLDKSVTISKQVVETFKTCKKPADIKTCELLKNAVIKESENNINIALYYDEDWKTLDKPDNATQEKAAFLVSSVIKTPGTGTAAKDKKGIYNIKVQVLKTKQYMLEKKKESEIYALSAVKYFAIMQ